MNIDRRAFFGWLLALPLVRRLPIAQPVVAGIDPATFQFWRNRDAPGVEIFFDMDKLRQRAELDEMIAIKTDRWDLYADARVDFDDL